MTNYYHILEVSTNASTTDIKKSYRRLAFKYHPDTSDNWENTAHFNLIKEAYETLIDANARAEYDLQLFYGKSFVNIKNDNPEEQKNNYKKYGSSKRNPTAGKYKPPAKTSKQIKFPQFETFMFRTLLSFGIIGFINAIRDLFIHKWDGINSLTGFFFSITFTTLLVVSWRNYKKSDE